MSGFWMVTAGDGCLTTLLVETLLPFLLASVLILSFYLHLFKNSCLQVESLRCSTLMWSLLGMILFLTCLLTMTPRDLGLTLKTVPVLP